MKPNKIHAALLCLLMLCASALCCAHDLGAMQVMCTFEASGTYTVEVLVDREHLPFRMARMPAAAFAAAFAEATQFRFDERLDAPQYTGARAGNGPNQFKLLLQGSVPQGARTFKFSSKLDLNEYFLRLKNAGDPIALGFWLNRDLVHPPFSLSERSRTAAALEVVRQYVVLGCTHIVPKGLDHILFVLGLFLLSARAKPLLWQVTAFTLAHSITLALSVYQVIALPARIVEPLIALSITYVAIENLLLKDYRPWRPAIVFAFGLLHGLGFAGVLNELGLPREQFAVALVSFNIGVEIGQLAVIAAAFLCAGWWFGHKPWYRARIVVPGSMLIALVGLYWTIERVAAGLA